MSRIGTYPLKENESMFAKLPPQNLSGTLWTEPISVVEVASATCFIDQQDMLQFDAWQPLAGRTRAMTASIYEIAQMLSQAIISPIHLLSISSSTQQHSYEHDVWIDMPPRSVKDVVMNVQRMGRGEPIDFFDELLEESL